MNMNMQWFTKCVQISPMRSLGRQREWSVQLVFNFPPVWVLLNGHILAVIVAPVRRTGVFYTRLSAHSRAEGHSARDLTEEQGL